MSTATLDPQKQTAAESRFEWPLCYEAENFILEKIDAFTQQNTFARTCHSSRAARYAFKSGSAVV